MSGDLPNSDSQFDFISTSVETMFHQLALTESLLIERVLHGV